MSDIMELRVPFLLNATTGANESFIMSMIADDKVCYSKQIEFIPNIINNQPINQYSPNFKGWRKNNEFLSQ